MAIITSSQFKTFVKDATSTNDTPYGWAIAAVNRWIPTHCKRSFEVAGSATQRFFVPATNDVVRISDCTTVTAVTNVGTTITSGSYQLEPLNGINSADQTVPYEQIRLLSGAWIFGYPNPKQATIAVTATWGWAAVPDEVTEAALILAADMYRNREMRFGVISATEFAGVRARSNPQVLELLHDLRRPEAFGIA